MKALTGYRSSAAINVLCDYLSAKQVLLAGSAGEMKDITDKLKANTWLHQRLDEVCKLLIGIERSDTLIRYMRDWLGFSNTVPDDLCRPGEVHPAVKEKKWDCMVVDASVFEAGVDVLGCLKTINRRYGPYVDELILLPPGFDVLSSGKGYVPVTAYGHPANVQLLTAMLAEAAFSPVQPPLAGLGSEISLPPQWLRILTKQCSPPVASANKSLVFAKFNDNPGSSVRL